MIHSRVVLYFLSATFILTCLTTRAAHAEEYFPNYLGKCKNFFDSKDIKLLNPLKERVTNKIDDKEIVNQKVQEFLPAFKGEISALSCALYFNNKNAFLNLLEEKADPNLVLGSGRTLMHYASEIRDTYYLETLIQFGGDVNIKNKKNLWKPTPIFHAVMAGNVQAVDVLLSAGVDLEYKNSMNETVLLVAAGLLDYDMTYFLLCEGADYYAEDNMGDSLYEILTKTEVGVNAKKLLEKKNRVIRLLKSKNAGF